ncbi:triosephosphate isomerase [Candidatus Anaplasma sp. TIGMIC]|uniref:triosephosphate isomerase n=1 Tax=Candidatus Anaplasma sp. TIGMIC TaxID=3020713 RepID=UPI00232D4D25|nr:triosephosphate isomerase [Candidatus Anaplasma sp. TIGMIC]MDB1135708.1 triosephosphate isomerase [Candidatus Anaplasma sp. TIGMIC]
MSFLVVANWKANGDLGLANEFLDSLCSYVTEYGSGKVEAVFCPPFVAMPTRSQDCPIRLGGQDCFHESGKGCTGEITAGMLHRCGCEYVILGHSDRRLMLGEADGDIRRKSECAISAGLKPIICVGETLEERKGGVSREVLLRQCRSCLPIEGEFFVAYEPIWAIGGSEIPDVDLIRESLGVIKSCDPDLKVLYGGSVSDGNICDLVAGISDIAGVLVGSASLSSSRFCSMMSNLEKCL